MEFDTKEFFKNCVENRRYHTLGNILNISPLLIEEYLYKEEYSEDASIFPFGQRMSTFKYNVLYYACVKNDIELYNFLQSIDKNCVGLAISDNGIIYRDIDYLIDKDMDYFLYNILILENLFGRTDLDECLIKSARFNKPKCFKMLYRFYGDNIAYVVDTNANNIAYYCLHNKQMLEIVIKGNACIETYNSFGTTLLIEAIKVGNKDVVEVVLKEGISADIGCTSGIMPYTYCIDRNRYDLLQLLVDYGCFIDELTKEWLYSKKYLEKTINDSKKDFICAICFEDKYKNVETLQCSHEFHSKCINSWFRTSGVPTCPICRK